MKFSRRGIKIYYKSTVSLSPYNTFVESGVLVLATEKGRKDFKESLQLAGEEVAAVGRVIDTVINKQEDDKRNPIGVLGEERQAEKWRNEGLVEDFKNAYFQENSNAEANNASVNINPNDIKYEGGKYVVDDTVVLFNKDNMKKENYVSIPVRLNPVTGEWIYQDMNLKNVMNHEGIHITDDLLNGMAIEKKNGILQNIMHTENNILFYKKGQTFITDIVTPMSEIRAMEHEGKLSIINREGLVDREIYSPGNLKNSRPVF